MVLISFPKSVNIVAGNSIRGTGDARWMLITQFIGTIMIIAVSAHMIFVVKMGLAGLLLANFADEFWRSIVNYGRFIIGGKRLASRDPLPCSATITDNVRV
jgi:Na+-driven multidrug efflux pump